MNTVWKFTIPISDICHVSMPDGAEILHVAQQHPGDNHISLWARVDPDAETVERQLRVAGTHHPHADGAYIGTVTLHDGQSFHVFDEGPL